MNIKLFEEENEIDYKKALPYIIDTYRNKGDINKANETLYYILCNGYAKVLIDKYGLQLDYELYDIIHYMMIFGVDILKNEVDYTMTNAQIVSFIFKPRRGRLYSYLRKQSSERMSDYVKYPENTRTLYDGGDGYSISHSVKVNQDTYINNEDISIFDVHISDYREEYNYKYKQGALSELDYNICNYISENAKVITNKKGIISNITYSKTMVMQQFKISYTDLLISIENIKKHIGKEL